MIDLDGTDNKSKLGANGILAVSLAVARVRSLSVLGAGAARWHGQAGAAGPQAHSRTGRPSPPAPTKPARPPSAGWRRGEGRASVQAHR